MLSIRLNTLRMDKETILKRITEWRPISVRRICRPTLGGEDDVRKDVGRKKFENGSKLALDREARKRIVEQVKAHKEL